MDRIAHLFARASAVFGFAVALFVFVAMGANATALAVGQSLPASSGNAAAIVLAQATGTTGGSGLTATQIQAIISLLQSFGANQSVVTNVQAALNGQTTTGDSSSSCLSLMYNLYAGTTDATTNGEISQLQQFLGVSPTGYFGPQTEVAVQNWQASHGVVSSGSPDTTGYGFVGPQTRKAMGCGGGSTAVSTNVPVPLIMIDCTQGYVAQGGQCVPISTTTTVPPVVNSSSPQSATGPTITSIDGPPHWQLGEGETGTWTVHATGGTAPLSYSVIWGDEESANPTPAPAQSSPTFTHLYTGPYVPFGRTIAPAFTVTDAAGRSMTAANPVVINYTGSNYLIASVDYGPAPFTVTFIGNSTGNNTAVLDYGDGSPVYTVTAGSACSSGGSACTTPKVAFLNQIQHTYKAAGTYTATFKSGDTGAVIGSRTITVVNLAAGACAFNYSQIPNGGTVTAYRTPIVALGQTCPTVTLTCTDGTLTGGSAAGIQAFPTCTPGFPVPQ